MKPLIRNLGMVVSLSLAIACKKNTGTSDPGNTSIKLSKVIVWTSKPTAPTIEIYTYHFDTLNRVTEMTYFEGDSSSGESQAQYVRSTKWLYNGNQQQPFKSTGASVSGYEKYYFYDNQGKLISDSMVTDNCNCYYLEKYSWFTDKIMINSASATYSVGVTDTFKDSGVINGTNYLGNYNFNNFPAQLNGRIYSYDNKINPFQTLNIKAAIVINPTEWGATVGYSGNNVTENTRGTIPLNGSTSGTFIKATTVTYKYAYNSDNLPVTCEVMNNVPYPYPVKVQYYYTN